MSNNERKLNEDNKNFPAISVVKIERIDVKKVIENLEMLKSIHRENPNASNDEILELLRSWRENKSR